MTTKNKHQFICTDSIKGMFFSAKLYNVFGCFTTLNLQSLLSLIDNPNEFVKDCTWFVQNITQICFSWKSACKNTLQRSFSYSVSSKSVSVKMSHCSLAVTKICSHNWQRRQLIIATIHFVIPIPHISQNFWRVKFTPKFIQ